MTHLELFKKEQALRLAGFDVPPYPRPGASQDDAIAQRLSDQRFLTACDAWDCEVRRLHAHHIGRTAPLAN